MNSLSQTLLELENFSQTIGKLDKYYVRDIYPQYKSELKNIGIPDFDRYENYTLENVHGDLKHLLLLLEGSLPKENFKKKLDFLVQLSQRMLSVLPRPAKQKKEDKKEILIPTKINLTPLNDLFDKSQKENLKPHRPLKSQDKKTPIGHQAKINKDANKHRELLRSGPVRSEQQNKIPERMDTKEEALNETFEKLKQKEVKEPEEISLELPPEHEEMVQGVLHKYEISEEAWKNYILDKINSHAQYRRMGIETQPKKIDCSIESLKFVEEIEYNFF